MASNCGTCKNCKDMSIFGGKNKLRQACEVRTCVNRKDKVTQLKAKEKIKEKKD